MCNGMGKTKANGRKQAQRWDPPREIGRRIKAFWSLFIVCANVRRQQQQVAIVESAATVEALVLELKMAKFLAVAHEVESRKGKTTRTCCCLA